MLRRRPAITVAVTLLAVVGASLAGCGGTASNAGEVARVTHRWSLSVANRNVDEACSLLDEHGRAMIRRQLAGFIAAHTTGSSCPELIGFLHDAVMTPAQRKELPRLKASEVSVSGNAAKARVGGAYFLRRTSQGWRISEVPLTVASK
jgi:hypothetical protein